MRSAHFSADVLQRVLLLTDASRRRTSSRPDVFAEEYNIFCVSLKREEVYVDVEKRLDKIRKIVKSKCKVIA